MREMIAEAQPLLTLRADLPNFVEVIRSRCAENACKLGIGP